MATDINAIRDEETGKLPAYAWPGGYPIVYFTADMGTLCPSCANGENGSRSADTDIDPGCPDDDQWRIVAYNLFLEGENVDCEHCGFTMCSAYGDPDAPDGEV